MRILVTGASGLLGYEVVKHALTRGHLIYSVYNTHPINLGQQLQLDLTVHNLVAERISEIRPQAIIHAAAHTNVDDCEVNKEHAWKVNTEATKNLAIISHRINAQLIYVSTDYVFDGEKGLYTEDDRANPINHYGYTKLMGEYFIKEHAEKWCIARTSALYGWGHEHKTNFATWLIDNLKKGGEVKTLTDQHVSPTLNLNLADMLMNIAEREVTGTLHTAGASRISRYHFALELAEVFNLNKDLVKKATMKEMSWKARRPKDSSLDISRTIKILDTKPLQPCEALIKMRDKKLDLDV